MAVDQWMGPAAVVDLTHLGENGEVTAVDLERRAGHVERGGGDGRLFAPSPSWSSVPVVGRSAGWRHRAHSGHFRYRRNLSIDV